MHDLVQTVSNGKEEILVPARCHHLLHERVDRHLLGPELTAHENHRAGKPERQIVVLYCILEDFLKRSGTTRCIDDAAKGKSQDAVLANAVLKELGNVRCKRRGWLVTIKPRGYAKAHIRPLWILAAHRKG